MWAEYKDRGRWVGLFFERIWVCFFSISLFIFCEIDGHLIKKKKKGGREMLEFGWEKMAILGILESLSTREKIGLPNGNNTPFKVYEDLSSLRMKSELVCLAFFYNQVLLLACCQWTWNDLVSIRVRNLAIKYKKCGKGQENDVLMLHKEKRKKW